MSSISANEPKPLQPSGAKSALSWCALAVVTVAVFARSLGGELVYDDLLMIGRNPDLSSLANVPSFFSRPYWAFLEPETRVGFWRPLTATALALGHALGSGAPWGFHLVSLGAHLLALTGAFLLTLRFSGRTSLAGWTALLFALHPLQVEGVAWITALNDPLSTGCTLMALWCWLGWRRNDSRGLPLGALAWFALALLCKEAGLVLLPLVFLLDLVLERSGQRISTRHNVIGYGALGACLLAWLVARAFVFESPWGGFDLVSAHLGVDATRLATLRVELFGGALRLLAWPTSLTLFRPFRPFVTASDPSLVWGILASAGYAVLLWVVWRKRANRMLFALGFLPAALSIMLLRVEALGIFPLSDRFLSLAVYGFALILTLLISSRTGRWATALLGLLALTYGAHSFLRIGDWKDEESLFRDAAAKTNRSPYVQWGLGRVLLGRYLETDDPGFLNEAEKAYVAAQDLLVESRELDADVFATSGDFLQVNLGYGWCRLLQDERSGYGSDVALQLFQDLAERIESIDAKRLEARSLGIRVVEPYLELEQVYTAIGVALARSGRLAEAESALREAIERNPLYPEAHQNLGRLYAQLEEWELAERHFERAASLRPGHEEDLLLLAQAAARGGNLERAETLARSLTRNSEHPESLYVLAEISIARKEAEGALRWSQRALELDRDSGQAWYLRGQALLLSGEFEAASTALERSAELRPDHFASFYDLGALLARRGELERAVPALLRAYELCTNPRLMLPLRDSLAAVAFTSTEPLVQLAVIDARRLANEAALAWLEKALLLDPEDGSALLQKSRLLRRLERHEEALLVMVQACSLLPESFHTKTELGAYLEERGRVEEAIVTLEEAVRLGPPPEWPPELSNQTMADLEARLARLRAQRAAAESTGTG